MSADKNILLDELLSFPIRMQARYEENYGPGWKTVYGEDCDKACVVLGKVHAKTQTVDLSDMDKDDL